MGESVQSPAYKASRMEDYTTDYKAGQDNVSLFGFDVHNPVFGLGAGLMILFIVATLAAPETAGGVLNAARGWVLESFDWFFMISVNIITVFCIVVAFSPLGRIRLGGKNARTEYSTLSWFCMLFASGVGIGLLFWGVAEPVAYYTDWYGTPLNVAPRTEAAADLALSTALFHWGVQGWATFGIVGLALAFFSYNRGMPFTMRSVFYPIFRERCWGPIGHGIDVLAVIGTVFGLATSLGLGVQQIASGLEHLFGITNSIETQLVIISAIVVLTWFSIMRGMSGGVRFLSNLNLLMAIALLAVVYVVGFHLGITEKIGTIFVSYARDVWPLSNWVGREDTSWFHGWTVFYWAWWVSWSPFVGMFMARISKGRTVREFFLAVFIVPTIFIGIWFAIMGGTALELVSNNESGLKNGLSDVSLALYQMYEALPLSDLLSVFSVLLLALFFVTSADSGAIVVDSITSGGKVDAPMKQRLFWATVIGMIAAALLVGGGTEALSALQAGVITTGLPFTLVLLLLCYSLFKGLQNEFHLTGVK